MQHSNCYSNVKNIDDRQYYKIDSCGKSSSELCFLDILSTDKNFSDYFCVISISKYI